MCLRARACGSGEEWARIGARIWRQSGFRIPSNPKPYSKSFVRCTPGFVCTVGGAAASAGYNALGITHFRIPTQAIFRQSACHFPCSFSFDSQLLGASQTLNPYTTLSPSFGIPRRGLLKVYRPVNLVRSGARKIWV